MPGKRYGRHPDKALSAVAVRNATKGRYADGNGLYLEVEESGSRRWIQRLTINGRRRELGLGSARLVTLAEAREVALENRRQARSGIDPLAERRKSLAPVPDFETSARTCHEENRPSWKNPKHAAQWITTLETYVFPTIGQLPVDQIGMPEVRDCLEPIWLSKAETARRVRQRVGTVLDWATTKGWRQGENPVRGVSKGLPKQKATVAHFAAMPWADVPAFIKRLQMGDEAGRAVRLMFEFLILTAARSGEVRGARWSEIDLEERVWTIPADRMKGGKTHIVPLSSRVIEILDGMTAYRIETRPNALIFNGSKIGKPHSDMVLTSRLRDWNIDATAHGFRSSFRDWAAEATITPREVAEAALAHAVPDRVEAAYRRSDLLVKRRALMEAWAAFVETGLGANVASTSTTVVSRK